MIRLTDVEKVYRTDRLETVALSNINLGIKTGEFVSIAGPSGCGKTTLLSTIVVGIGETWHLEEAVAAEKMGPLSASASST
mgnify:CR=1 FL=1